MRADQKATEIGCLVVRALVANRVQADDEPESSAHRAISMFIGAVAGIATAGVLFGADALAQGYPGNRPSAPPASAPPRSYPAPPQPSSPPAAVPPRSYPSPAQPSTSS